jgi:creatinine amidohydrolase
MGIVYHLGNMTREQVAAVAPSAIAVVPIGSTEQHGAHLPLLTDSLICEAVTREAISLLEIESPIVIAPLLPIGSSNHHLFACTVSFSADTYVRVLRDICTSLATSGFRRLVFVNGHGGNDLPMRLVCNDVILDSDITVGACSYWTLTSVLPDPPITPLDHAGTYETALVMHIAGDLVGTPAPGLGNKNAFFDLVLSPGFLVNRHGEWSRIGGVTGPADGASAELGRRILEDRAAALAEVLRKFDQETKTA